MDFGILVAFGRACCFQSMIVWKPWAFDRNAAASTSYTLAGRHGSGPETVCMLDTMTTKYHIICLVLALIILLLASFRVR